RFIVDSATRNTRYASVDVILFGAITVTFLPVDTMRGSRMKFLQVKPITHVIRSFSSVSGLNVTATCPVRFLQLYSASSSPGAAVVDAADGFATRSVAGWANAVCGTEACVRRPATTPVVTMVATSDRRALSMISPDRVLQRDGLAATRDLDFERGRLAQLRIDFERLVGRGQLEAVDRLQGVAVGQAELGERRGRPDRVELEAIGLAVLHRRNHPRALGDRHRVQEDLFDQRLVDLVVRFVELLDAAVDRGLEIILVAVAAELRRLRGHRRGRRDRWRRAEQHQSLGAPVVLEVDVLEVDRLDLPRVVRARHLVADRIRALLLVLAVD